MTLYRVAAFVMRFRWWVVGSALLAVAVVSAITMLRPREYTASASFVTHGAGGAGNVAGLAAQFGLNVPAGAPAESPAFYAELLRSRELTRAVVMSDYRLGAERSGSLTELLDLKTDVPAQRVLLAGRWLAEAVSVAVSDKTGIIRLNVRAADPRLAAQIAQRLLGELARYNLERRQSQAAAERRFAEQRLGEARADLREAEERQRAFLQRNRQYSGSAELQLQLERLERDVSRYNQVYATLVQSFEQAKLEEVRDTPVLTILDAPEVPLAPDGRGLLLKALLALLGGAAAGALLALTVEFRQRMRERGQMGGGTRGRHIDESSIRGGSHAHGPTPDDRHWIDETGVAAAAPERVGRTPGGSLSDYRDAER